MIPANSKKPTGTPTPIPIFALLEIPPPSVSPLFGVWESVGAEVGEEDDGLDVVVCEEALDVVEDVRAEELVEEEMPIVAARENRREDVAQQSVTLEPQHHVPPGHDITGAFSVESPPYQSHQSTFHHQIPHPMCKDHMGERRTYIFI